MLNTLLKLTALLVCTFASLCAQPSAQDKAAIAKVKELMANNSTVSRETREAALAKRLKTPLSVGRIANASAAAEGVGTSNSYATYETFTNITVAPGGVLKLTSSQEWSGASHASIAIHCPTSTSLENFGIVPQWATPDANFYTNADVLLGSSFIKPYNQGGFVVSVYGSVMQTSLVNIGTANVTCDQVTVYASVR